MTRDIAKALLIICLAGSLSAATTTDAGSTDCAMSPSHVRIPVPASRSTWVEGEALSGPCGKVPAQQWTPAPSKALNVMVHADGPSGSGRFWTIAVGLAEKPGIEPNRAFCMVTSTVGWRTLQNYRRTPLPWLADLDADGASELLIWDSFPLRDGSSLAEYALVAWVYRPDAEGTFTIDWRLSRGMAAELAEAYRAPTTERAQRAEALREKASQDLEAFAHERCRSAPMSAR